MDSWWLEEPQTGDDLVRRPRDDGRGLRQEVRCVRVRSGDAVGGVGVELVDESGAPIAVVSTFLRHLAARGCSPNTLAAYAYDLRHLWLFLAARGLAWQDFGPPHALELLEALRATPSRRPAQRLGLTVATSADGRPARRLAPATVNRVLAAVSSFYEYAILAGVWDRANPIEKRPDPSLAAVPSVIGRSWVARAVSVRSAARCGSRRVQRVPRPLDEGQVRALLGELRCVRDRAIVLLMLQGGLRPGEVLGLQLDDIAYGRRRVVVRHREDHPKGVRQKSRHERVVDLHEPEALAAVSEYVMRVRPADAEIPLVFLIGGRGSRRLEAFGYDGLVRMFARACARAGIREPWITPHALRHTHATRMWEGGMRELSLQKRLGSRLAGINTDLHARV